MERRGRSAAGARSASATAAGAADPCVTARASGARATGTRASSARTTDTSASSARTAGTRASGACTTGTRAAAAGLTASGTSAARAGAAASGRIGHDLTGLDALVGRRRTDEVVGRAFAVGVALAVVAMPLAAACIREEPAREGGEQQNEPRLKAHRASVLAQGVSERDRRAAPGVDAPAARTVVGARPPPLRAPPPRRGVGLGLFSEDVSFSYAGLLDEIRELGANEVMLVVPLYQDDVRATIVFPHPRYSPTADRVEATIHEARARGLAVSILPIVRLLRAGADEWRGTLRPADPGLWFRRYGDAVLELARHAARAGADELYAGSELGSLDGPEHLADWRALVSRLRAVFHGRIGYAANWDRWDRVRAHEAADVLGISAYFPLSRWPAEKARLVAAQRALGKPLVLTEVGFLSQQGLAERPWEEAAAAPIDLEEQRRAYAELAALWDGVPELSGLWFWNWYGHGGPRSRSYSPRGKPAAEIVRAWYGSARR